MSWIKIDDSMVDHPKIAPRSDRAFRWIHRALSYANRFPADGVLPPAFLDQVPTAVRTELVNGAVWEQDRDGVTRIHDYLDYQPSKAEAERQREDAKLRQRKRRGKVTGEVTRDSRVTHSASHGVTNGAPSRPGPSRPIKKKNPPNPPAGAGGLKPRREDWRAAEKMFHTSWGGYCQHTPACANTVSCKDLIAHELRRKRADAHAGGHS